MYESTTADLLDWVDRVTDSWQRSNHTFRGRYPTSFRDMRKEISIMRRAELRRGEIARFIPDQRGVKHLSDVVVNRFDFSILHLTEHQLLEFISAISIGILEQIENA